MLKKESFLIDYLERCVIFFLRKVKDRLLDQKNLTKRQNNLLEIILLIITTKSLMS